MPAFYGIFLGHQDNGARGERQRASVQWRVVGQCMRLDDQSTLRETAKEGVRMADARNRVQVGRLRKTG